MIRIIGAMPEELAQVKESPPHVLAICSGVGKVNAALAVGPYCAITSGFNTIVMIGTSGAADPSLNVGDVVIATDTMFHDVDVTALGFAPGQIPYAEKWRWSGNDRLLNNAFEAVERAGCVATFGRVVTGDRFVSDPSDVARIRATFNASAIDMETAAVAMSIEQSEQYKRGYLRWCSIRIISDRADKSAAADFPTFLPRATKQISRIVEELVEILD